MKANPLASIDSLKIRIPLGLVEVINPLLNDHTIDVPVSVLTGEHYYDEMDENQFKEKCFKVSDRGIQTRYVIANQQRGDAKVGAFLTLLLTSKQTATKEGYYTGINLNTISEVHQYLMDQNVCSFDLETLLISDCTDIDIKKDFNSTEEEFAKLTDRLSKSTFCTMELGRGHERFCNIPKEENGIQWATRRTKTPRTNPFVKLYSKHFDLINQSRADRISFVKHILDGDEGKDIFRIETTIKNKDHLSSFGITDNSLRGILSLSPDTLSSIISTNLKKQVEPREQTIEQLDYKGATPKDQETLNAIMMGMHYDLPYQAIRTILTSQMTGANLSKRGGRLDGLYKAYIQGSKSDEATQEMEKYFELIGWT